MKKIRPETTTMSLHLMAMTFMLCDHLWGTLVPGSDWMTCVGRLAFPIFAFLIVEGYFHTRSLKKYTGRLLLLAILSEIPYNLMMGGSVINPLEQNVIWTFLIGILLIYLNEKARKTGKIRIQALVWPATLILGFFLGLFGFVDYNFAGVFMILVFYLTRERKMWALPVQILLLWYINVELISGFAYEMMIFGHPFYLVRQGFALLALIPIWMYRGRQGPHGKTLQFLYYSFYPVHMLILDLLQML